MISVKEYFVNLGLMITIIYLTGFFYKQFLVKINDRLKEYILVLIAVFTGWISMIYGIHLTSSVIFDLRFIPIILAALYARNAQQLIFTGLGIGLMRFTFGVTDAAWIGFLNVCLISMAGLILSLVSRSWSYQKKMWWMVIGLNVINTAFIVAFGVLPAEDTLKLIMPIVFPINILLSLLLVWIVKDLTMEYVYKLELIEKASIDPLTQLYNRRAFMRYYNDYTDSEEEIPPFSVAFIDIDHFKKVNDTYGHIFGDKVLQKVSSIISENLRDIDIVARYGGEEFVVILPNCAEEDAIKVMERIRVVLAEEPLMINRISTAITVSVGIASLPDIKKENLLMAADKALYRAKNSGRNQVFSADEEMQLEMI
ncbi:GGDEF domain-containing protein [Falsibacillus pallidus]|uniref:Diguanylate cyclase n=1 Tax=Falsibacillus pallidus TaxID=493781 RepID=A0A370GPG6_9BACI|nr:diguanylate cyclase [Falsibacillus pallidus]RDI45625.1 diguanylate cyclase [Falsibacillus pallidus]